MNLSIQTIHIVFTSIDVYWILWVDNKKECSTKIQSMFFYLIHVFRRYDTSFVLFFFRYYKLINKQSKHYIYAPLKLGSVTMIICKHVDCVKLFLTNLILFILSEINYEIVSIGIAIYVYKGFS